MPLPDVQSSKPEIQINLTRVGVTDVKKLVKVSRGEKRPVILISTFNIFVDLPKDRKGANLSRNFEAIDEVLEERTYEEVAEIEELCSKISEELLKRHEYASRAEVQMKSEYVIRRTTPVTKMSCQEVVDIFASAVSEKSDGRIVTRKSIGAEVVGMTACPCAQGMMKEIAVKKLRELGMKDESIEEFLSCVPIATHNQRGRGFISIEVGEKDKIPSLDRIIEIIEDSMSSRIYELLKRKDEANVVMGAHRNPKFVEDCVREMARRVVEEFPELSDDAIITIKQINEESIHRHNAFAEKITTMGELRRELKSS
ncbi:MAG: cyclohydrolase [Archaeoglobi archaeon]|nr:cyclohydrolase [Archaeoglobi archaeon]